MQEQRRIIIERAFADHTPHRVICVSEQQQPVDLPLDVPCDWLNSSAWLQEPSFTQRYDLALLLPPADTPLADLHRLMAYSRDLLARRVLAFLPHQHDSSYSALAYTLQARHHPQESAWGFDILSYKQVPDWLNSRYWANPENFDRYRW